MAYGACKRHVEGAALLNLNPAAAAAAASRSSDSDSSSSDYCEQFHNFAQKAAQPDAAEGGEPDLDTLRSCYIHEGYQAELGTVS